ncbi:MAG TPA: hypothetical protein VMU83_12125 [Hanamia sp.]|nr:hypothetical protein [Hanamia sp.]
MKKLCKMIKALFIISLFLSCNKENLTQHKSPTEYFPNTIGNYWEYNVYDSGQIPVDPKLPRNYTVKVSIIGIKKLVDSIDAYVWQISYPDGNDFRYIRMVGDTIKVFDTIYSRTVQNLQFPRHIFLIPFHDGDIWQNDLYDSDIYTTSLVRNVAVNWQFYDSAFKIFDHYLGPETEFKDTYWFKPNIGIIKIYLHEYIAAPLNIQLWQLKSYYLK